LESINAIAEARFITSDLGTCIFFGTAHPEKNIFEILVNFHMRVKPHILKDSFGGKNNHTGRLPTV